MPLEGTHECSLTLRKTSEDTEDLFRCKACGFMGSLIEAIKHAVANQFTIRS